MQYKKPDQIMKMACMLRLDCLHCHSGSENAVHLPVAMAVSRNRNAVNLPMTATNFV